MIYYLKFICLLIKDGTHTSARFRFRLRSAMINARYLSSNKTRIKNDTITETNVDHIWWCNEMVNGSTSSTHKQDERMCCPLTVSTQSLLTLWASFPLWIVHHNNTAGPLEAHAYWMAPIVWRRLDLTEICILDHECPLTLPQHMI